MYRHEIENTPKYTYICLTTTMMQFTLLSRSRFHEVYIPFGTLSENANWLVRQQKKLIMT